MTLYLHDRHTGQSMPINSTGFKYTFHLTDDASPKQISTSTHTADGSRNQIPASTHMADGSREQISASTHMADGSREQRSEEHTSELQSRGHLVCRLLLEKKK